MFVLDTNTLVYFFRGQGQVAGRLLATAPVDIGVPTLVVYALETGIAKSTDGSKRRRQLDELLGAVHVLPFDRPAARAAAEVRASLEAAGRPIGPVDTLIAGVARSVSGVLVTRNVKEFGRVPGLTVENWYE